MKSEMKTDELTKTLNEWALAAGRSMLSTHTGFIHYNYENAFNLHSASALWHTIPLYENMCFVLALFRSRLLENMQKAKDLLIRLLAFRNLETGNFPIYLHHYPHCHDQAVGIRLLAPLFWIQKYFGHILGEELKEKMVQAIERILHYSLTLQGQRPLSYSLSVRLAAAVQAFGKLWNNSEWILSGQHALDLFAQSPIDGWYTTEQLSEILIGLQMIYENLTDSPWNNLWQYMQQSWHYQSCCYAGPRIKEWQIDGEAKPNLYDLYAGYFAKQFSARAASSAPFHLQAALIQSSNAIWQNLEQRFILEGRHNTNRWKINNKPSYAYTWLEKKLDKASLHDQVRTNFALIWGAASRMHSFICQERLSQKVAVVEIEGGVELLFHFNALQEIAGQRAIECFTDFDPAMELTIDDAKGIVFEQGQTVRIKSVQQQVSFSFSVVQGSGHFIGHIMRSHRHAQCGDKLEKQLQSSDWTLFLRSIRLSEECVVSLRIYF